MTDFRLILISAVTGALVALVFDAVFWVYVSRIDEEWREAKRLANKSKRIQRQIYRGRTPKEVR